MAIFGLFGGQNKDNLSKGLEKTKENVIKKLSRAVMGKAQVDEEVLDNLEEVLISSDVGVDTTLRIIKRIETRVANDKYMGTEELNRILREEIAGLLEENISGKLTGTFTDLPQRPYVIMVVGVNGVGKTTTIGKLAYHFKKSKSKGIIGRGRHFQGRSN
jgi:fused signal recognition particle receptor